MAPASNLGKLGVHRENIDLNALTHTMYLLLPELLKL